MDFKEFEKQKLAKLSEMAISNSLIDPELYKKYEVKRGLRDLDGHGVLVGLTEIGEIQSYERDGDQYKPIPGRLIYRGIDINELVNGFRKEDRLGFEETAYLLLFGSLPNEQELIDFNRMLTVYKHLPNNFTRDVILGAPSPDIMNTMAKSVLAMYSFDDNPDDIEISNVLKQSIKLIAQFPALAVYAFHACSHYHGNQSLIIHPPQNDLSLAENILQMLRPDEQYTREEAILLDLALVLHAEHGGGNNSAFVTHVVTSTGTDTYSAIGAAIGSLKGPRHGGANIRVVKMMDDIKEHVSDWKDENEISEYLTKIVQKEAYDRSGLIYGVGHAVYTISDPRAVIFKQYVKHLAYSKGFQEEFELYEKVEKLAPKIIAAKTKTFKSVCVNIDFYSGLVYKMMNIPTEMYTPIFAISRIVGWSAHRIEEIANKGKIIRPAYNSVAQRRNYVMLADR